MHDTNGNSMVIVETILDIWFNGSVWASLIKSYGAILYLGVVLVNPNRRNCFLWTHRSR